MARRGPKGKSIEEHQLDGTLRPSRHGEIVELMPTPDMVDTIKSIPSHLSAGGKREWRKWAPIIAKGGIIRETDIPLFAQMCEMLGELKKVEREEAEFDRQAQIEDPDWNIPGLYRNKAGVILDNPKTKRKDVLRMQLLRFLAEFGMTPTARKQVVGIKPEKVNPWAKFAAPAQKKA